MKASEAKVLSAAEVAAELGLSRQQVHNLRKAGQLPATIVSRGATRTTWRFLPEDVAAYLDGLNQNERTP